MNGDMRGRDSGVGSTILELEEDYRKCRGVGAECGEVREWGKGRNCDWAGLARRRKMLKKK